MKSKRILLFALFTCVFALYGCVSSVSQSVNDRQLAMNINKNTLVVNGSNNALLQSNRQEGARTVLASIVNGTYDSKPRTRELDGSWKTKTAFKQVASNYNKEVKEKQEKLKKEKEKAEALKKQKEEEEAKRFVGKITTYGVDCYGCSFRNGRGSTATGVALDINLGVEQADGSFQPGIKYGNYYVVAADPSIPMYSILKISNHGLQGSGITPNEPFYAIVLDRGGAIYGGHIDLYIGSENSSAVRPVARTTPTVQVISYGK